MATYNLKLEKFPADARARELWLQHAAGLIIFEDVRKYAINQIDIALEEDTRAEVIKGIDNATYGLMMILDGVSGRLENSDFRVSLETKIVLTQKTDDEKDIILAQVNLMEGDGMCVGYHRWLEGNFGQVPIASER